MQSAWIESPTRAARGPSPSPAPSRVAQLHAMSDGAPPPPPPPPPSWSRPSSPSGRSAPLATKLSAPAASVAAAAQIGLHPSDDDNFGLRRFGSARDPDARGVNFEPLLERSTLEHGVRVEPAAAAAGGRAALPTHHWSSPSARRAALDAALQVRHTVSTFHFPTRRVTELARVFQLLDDNGDGLLDVEQLRIAIASAGFPPTPALLQSVINATPREWAYRGVDFDTFVTSLEAKSERDPLFEADLRELVEAASGLASTASAASAASRTDDAPTWAASVAALAAVPSSADSDPDAPLPTVVPAHVVRRLLEGVETQAQTQLQHEEVNALFRELGIASEIDRVDYADFFALLSGGYVHIFPEDAEVATRVRDAGEVGASAEEERAKETNEAEEGGDGRGEDDGGVWAKRPAAAATRVPAGPAPSELEQRASALALRAAQGEAETLITGKSVERAHSPLRATSPARAVTPPRPGGRRTGGGGGGGGDTGAAR